MGMGGIMSFDVFWQAYPRRVAKMEAKKAYDKALKSATHQEIMDGVQRYAIYTQSTEHRFIKHPASWLRAGCWEDELTDNRQLAPKSVGSVFSGLVAQMENGNGVRRIQSGERVRQDVPCLPFAFDEPR